MPVDKGVNQEGHYYQWGDSGTYYYDPSDEESKKEAKRKAEEQGRAIRAAGYGE